MTIETVLQRTTSAALALTLVLNTAGVLALSLLSGDAYEFGGLLFMLGLFSIPVSLVLIAGVGAPQWLARLSPLPRITWPVVAAALAVIGVLVKFFLVKFRESKERQHAWMNDDDEDSGRFKKHIDWFGFNWSTGKYEVKGPDGDFDDNDSIIG